MELWIRSQDRLRLCKANNLFIKNLSICCSCNDENNDYDYLGVYSTKERALEILDEISSKIKNRYIVTTTSDLISKDEMANEYKRLNYLYSGEFIMENSPFEIKPLNNDVIYYEMPKE